MIDHHGCGYQENSEGKVISTCGWCGKGNPTFHDWSWSSLSAGTGMTTPVVTQTPPNWKSWPHTVYAVMFYPGSDFLGTLMALFYNEELANEYVERQLYAYRYDVHEVEVNG